MFWVYSVLMITSLTGEYEYEYYNPSPPQPQDKYWRVNIHLIRWKEEGNLVCAEEVKDLQVAFSPFGHVQPPFLIPSGKDAQEAMTSYIQQLESDLKSGDLLILYYAGHGINSSSAGFQLQQEVPSFPI